MDFRATIAIMKKTVLALTAVAIVLAGAVSDSALARSGRSGGGHVAGRHSSGGGFSGHHFGGPRVRFGGFVAAPIFFYPPAPAYYYSPFFAAPSSPPVYIEQGSGPGAEAPAVGNWYYCSSAQAYYPNVAECAEGWQAVAPTP
jgi:hypothetical protein